MGTNEVDKKEDFYLSLPLDLEPGEDLFLFDDLNIIYKLKEVSASGHIQLFPPPSSPL